MRVFRVNVLIIVLCFVFVGTVYSSGKKGSDVEGRVVDRDGKPLSGVTVAALLSDGDHKEGCSRLEVKTKSDGTFLLEGLCPGQYYDLLLDGGQCNDQKDRFRSLPTRETLSLRRDYILFFSPFKVLSNGVIKELQAGLEWAPIPPLTMNYDLAVAYADTLGFAGGGWRLPTVDEVRDLYETGQSGCGLDWAFGNQYPRAWASDTKAPAKRWLMDFLNGEAYSQLAGYESSPCDNCRVLPVRPALHQ